MTSVSRPQAATGAGSRKGCVLVVGVGNVLRGDDMFGVVVLRHLAERGLPPQVDLLETGIAGISMVQELQRGYDALLILDAVFRRRPPGTLVMLEPQVPDPAELSETQRREFFSDLHQADPTRGLMLAKALGWLPAQVRVLGCEVGDCDELLTDLTPPVELAIPAAVTMALETIGGWLGVDLNPIEATA